jgi:hypothetical protein
MEIRNILGFFLTPFERASNISIMGAMIRDSFCWIQNYINFSDSIEFSVTA